MAKKEYIKDVVVTDIYQLNDTLRNSFAAVKEDISSIKEAQRKQLSEVVDLKKRIRLDEDNVKIKEFKAMTGQIDRINKDLQSLFIEKEIIQKAKKRLEELEEGNEDVQDRITRFEKNIQKLSNEIRMLIETRQAYLSLDDGIKMKKDIDSKISKVEGAYDSFKDFPSRIKQVEKKTVSMNYFDKQTSEITELIADLRERIDDLKDGSVSSKDYSSHLKEIEQRMKGLETDAGRKHREIFQEIKQLDKETVKAKKYKNDYRAIAKRLTIIKNPKALKYSKLYFSANILVILSFFALGFSIGSYFLKYMVWVYPFLIAAITLFLVGIIVRIIAIAKDQ